MDRETDELIPTRWTLIARLKQWDDHESWREFFETYWRLLYNVALRAGLSHAEAEEVVQETVIEVSHKMPGFAADPQAGSFKSWLLTLTGWRIKDRLRRRLRLSSGEQAVQVRDDAATSTDSPEASVASDDEFRAVWDDEWRRNVLALAAERVKRRVNPKHYQIFHLNVLKDVPAAEVARRLRVNSGQIYLAKHRVGRLFKQELARIQE